MRRVQTPCLGKRGSVFGIKDKKTRCGGAHFGTREGHAPTELKSNLQRPKKKKKNREAVEKKKQTGRLFSRERL